MTIPKKTCIKCKTEREVCGFSKSSYRPDGLNDYCRLCVSERNKAHYQTNREKHVARASAWREANPDRAKAQRAAWRTANPERYAEAQRQWTEANKERRKEYRKVSHARTKERANALARAWKKANPARTAALIMKRHAAKLRAVPSWADMERIAEFYEKARALTIETGIKHHVDHIVPLQSPVVSGLHCEANLQILTAHANQSKSNRLLPSIGASHG